MPYITTPQRLGREEGLKEAIQIQLKLRFGAEGVAMFPAVQALTDSSRLEEILSRIVSSAPITEIEQLLTEKP